MKRFVLFLFLLPITSFSQKNDTLINSINSSDTINKKYSHFFVNNPSKESIKTLTQYFNSFRFFDCLKNAAPIENTKFNFTNVQHLKIIDNYAQTIYHAEFDKEGRYKKLSYMEPYAEPHVLTFDYNVKNKFVEIRNIYNEKNELFMEVFAKQDTIITKIGESPALQIFKDEFDNYKKIYFSNTEGAFVKIAEFLDFAKRKCSTKNCIYSTIGKNTYRYDYTSANDGIDGYEYLYYNDNNNLFKIEFYTPNLPKTIYTITYDYFNE